MWSRFSFAAVVGLVAALAGGVSFGQGQRLERSPSRPSLPAANARSVPNTVVFANAAQVVAVSDRGSFSLSAVEETCAVFEFGGLGYESKIQLIADDGNFLYFQSTTHQLFVAIRSTSPFDIWFAANGATEFDLYVDSSRVYNAAANLAGGGAKAHKNALKAQK